MVNINKKYNISLASPQEELFDLGRVLNTLPWSDEAIQNELLPTYHYWFIHLAREFFKLPRKIIFRALMEDWTPETIAVACHIDPEEVPDNRVYGSNQ